MGLRMKGEGPDEIAGMATAMRERCVRIRSREDGRVVDLCGTGGARVTTFNVSTIAMFVVAAAGVRVAKHGNRAITSRCGSADLLEALGARVELEPPEVERILEAHGLCFMFAPKFHPAMQHAMGPRRELGVRTVFNILGPLTNPAGAKGHLLGVFSPDLVPLMSKVSARLGIEHALVVRGQAGMDEICLCCPTIVGEVADGRTRQFVLRPADFGFDRADARDLAGAEPETAAKEAVRILRGELGPKREMLLANAAAGIYVSGKVDSLLEALPLAVEALDSGRAFETLRTCVKATGGNIDFVSRAARTGLPVLMKDMVVDSRQIDAAALCGASALLLIETLARRGHCHREMPMLIDEAHDRKVGVVLEVHTLEEWDAAVETPADILGINNRNLATMAIDLGTTPRILAERVKDRPVIAMSGIETRGQVDTMIRAGADAVLVGTSIMHHDEPARKLQELQHG